eukprot:67631-Chlamydomonas_euryale.AAC.1
MLVLPEPPKGADDKEEQKEYAKEYSETEKKVRRPGQQAPGLHGSPRVALQSWGCMGFLGLHKSPGVAWQS